MLRRDFLRLGALGFALTPLAACRPDHQAAGHGAHQAVVSQGLPESQPLQALPRIQNLAAAPDFRSQLSIQPTRVPLADGIKPQLWLYNGQVAPLIEVTEGGQVLVAVDNQLAQPTTIHWHGVKVPGNQDGGPHHPIAPGDSRTYRFTVPQGNAGLHWFHPHPHGYLAEQIAHSLAGVLLVHPRQDPVPASIPAHLLVVTDLRLDEAGEVAPHSLADWMNGREGDLLLVNGQRNPELTVAPGSTFRLRLINACAGRYLRLALQQHGLQLLGTDGGYLEQPVALDEWLLVPGQRCDLLVRASEQSNQRFALQKLPYDRDWMGTEPPHYRQTETLLTLVTTAAAVQPPVALPATLAVIPPLAEPAVRREVVLSESMGEATAMMAEHGEHAAHQQPSAAAAGGHAGHGAVAPAVASGSRPPIRFLINGESFQPGRVMFQGKAGVVEEWEVYNASHMDHPFHVHGVQFQVTASRLAEGEWQPPAFRAWQDTVNLKPGQRLKLRLVFEQPGEWMFHCHVIEHEELGMMASILIE